MLLWQALNGRGLSLKYEKERLNEYIKIWNRQEKAKKKEEQTKAPTTIQLNVYMYALKFVLAAQTCFA